jgi:adenylate cyclase
MQGAVMGGRRVLLGSLLVVPLLGLALLLAVPALDVEWEHHPSHFWLVLGVAIANVGLGLLTSEAASRRGDARLFLVSLALLASAGFLGLHALATPGVVVDETNAGFVIATPIGLLLAAGLAAGSAVDLERRPASALRGSQRTLRVALAVVLIAWAAASVARVPLLDRPPSDEAPLVLRWLTPIGIALYAFAAARYHALYRRRRRVLPLAVAIAFVLLAEALVAVALGRSWHATWWEWHVLMAIAFGAIVLTARAEYRRERSFGEAFGGLYLEQTLERIDRRYSDAVGSVVAALREGAPLAPVLERLRRDGFTGEQIAVLERSARELAKVDDLFHRYVGPRLAERLIEQPSLASLGGKETEVTVVFADLAGFTEFSEGRRPEEVIEMLNAYWAAVVPAIVERERGLIERFAGDAVMAVFNALDDQPDHAARAARAALSMQRETEGIAAGRPEWPRFRVGINTGRAIIGNVGAGEQRTFSAIGDTTNVAARVQSAAQPGEVLLASTTYGQLRGVAVVDPLGLVPLKGRSQPTDLYRLRALDRGSA